MRGDDLLACAYRVVLMVTMAWCGGRTPGYTYTCHRRDSWQSHAVGGGRRPRRSGVNAATPSTRREEGKRTPSKTQRLRGRCWSRAGFATVGVSFAKRVMVADDPILQLLRTVRLCLTLPASILIIINRAASYAGVGDDPRIGFSERADLLVLDRRNVGGFRTALRIRTGGTTFFSRQSRRLGVLVSSERDFEDSAVAGLSKPLPPPSSA